MDTVLFQPGPAVLVQLTSVGSERGEGRAEQEMEDQEVALSARNTGLLGNASSQSYKDVRTAACCTSPFLKCPRRQ
eukprot:4818273-Pyramimonas_sp.AAC.1